MTEFSLYLRGSFLFALLITLFIEAAATKEPAAIEAAFLVDMMREKGVLLSTDGPLHNVIKIKPPMVLTAYDVDDALQKLDETLANCGKQFRP